MVAALCLQTMPGFLSIGQAKPVFILPVCLAIAVFEGEYWGACAGLAGGLLWDFTAGRTAGLIGLSLMLICAGVSVIVRLYFQANPGNFIMLTAASAFLLLSMDFLFFYAMRGYAGAGVRYAGVVFPTIAFTAGLSPLSFFAVKSVFENWD